MSTTVPHSPSNPARREFLLGSLLTLGAVSPLLFKPVYRADKQAPDFLEKAVPDRIGDYSFSSIGGLVLPSEEEIGNSIYDQILMRTYVSSANPPIMMMIGMTMGQNAWRHVHRPEACYSAVGFDVRPGRTVPVSGGLPDQNATFFTAIRPEHGEQVLYWIRVGQTFPTDNVQLNRALILANLSGELPPGVLLRLSVRRPDASAALAQLQQFQSALTDALTSKDREALIGQARV